MRKTKSFLVLFLLCCVQSHYGQYTDLINSNRPGKSMSAFSVGKTIFQVEGGIYGINEEHNLKNYTANGFGTDLNIRYGEFWERFEMNLETQFQYDWYQAALVNDTRSG